MSGRRYRPAASPVCPCAKEIWNWPRFCTFISFDLYQVWHKFYVHNLHKDERKRGGGQEMWEGGEDSDNGDNDEKADRVTCLTWLGHTCNNGNEHAGLLNAGLSCNCCNFDPFNGVGLSAPVDSSDDVGFDDRQNFFRRGSLRLPFFE